MRFFQVMVGLLLAGTLMVAAGSLWLRDVGLIAIGVVLGAGANIAHSLIVDGLRWKRRRKHLHY